MKHVCLSYVNYGQCPGAGKPVESHAAQRSSCSECGEPLISMKSTRLPLSLFIGVVLILVVGFLVIFLSIRSKASRVGDGHDMTDNKIVGVDNSSLDPSGYFVDSTIGFLLSEASKGNREAIRKIVIGRPELLWMTGKRRITALHAAVFSQDARTFETLLVEGFDPSVFERNRMTLVMTAAMHPNPRFLATALNKIGKVPDLTDYKGRDALYIAFANRQSQNVKTLLRHWANANYRDAEGITVQSGKANSR